MPAGGSKRGRRVKRPVQDEPSGRTVTVYLTSEEIEWLNHAAEDAGVSRSAVIADCIRCTRHIASFWNNLGLSGKRRRMLFRWFDPERLPRELRELPEEPQGQLVEEA